MSSKDLSSLSSSVLSICDSRDLSYEAASELCDLSPRYFGSIARDKTAPSVNTLEKLCRGLEKTPNDLLKFSSTDEELSYRIAMQVIHYRHLFFHNVPPRPFLFVTVVIALWSVSINLSVIAVGRNSPGIAFAMLR